MPLFALGGSATNGSRLVDIPNETYLGDNGNLVYIPAITRHQHQALSLPDYTTVSGSI